MRKNKHMTDLEKYTALIQRNFPHIALHKVQLITRGWDSLVVDVNDEFIFRFPMRDDVVKQLELEQHVLPELASTLSTPIPHFNALGHGDASYPYMFVGYRKLHGVSLEDKTISQQQLLALVPALATFLHKLHSFPLAQAVQAGVQEHTPEQWRARYQERYVDLQKRVFPLLNGELCAKSEQLWRDFLDTRANFVFQPTLIHCDLGSEHILCEPERGVLTGIIDWGDITIGDPALDFVGLHWRGGRDFVQNVLAHYQGTIDAAFWQRMDFYLSYSPFAELLYGAYSENAEFITQGITGLHTLFRM
jgi:aminoglycoside 2''-phosphotransferase